MTTHSYNNFITGKFLVTASLVTLVIILFLSCSKHENKETKNQKAKQKMDELRSSFKSKLASSIDFTRPRYHIKSGIIILEEVEQLTGFKKMHTVYFDDYGKKERDETEDLTYSTRYLEIIHEGDYYNIPLWRQDGSKYKLSDYFTMWNNYPLLLTFLDFSNLSDQVKTKWRFMKKGSGKILGKKCVIFSFRIVDEEFKGEVWVWNNIILKMVFEDMELSGKGAVDRLQSGGMTLVAKKIELDVDIPASKFEVPPGIKIDEITLDILFKSE